MTVEVWRRGSPQQTPRGERYVYALHHTEDHWSFAPPTPGDGSEPVEANRDLVVETLTGYREDLATDILATDELVIPGTRGEQRWKVRGTPGEWRDAGDGRYMGSVCYVRRDVG